jgi:hypothetical protein
VLLGKDNSSSKNSQENSTDNYHLAGNSNGNPLIYNGSESKAPIIKRPGTVYYRDINLFLLRNPGNPEGDVPRTAVDVTPRKGCAR